MSYFFYLEFVWFWYLQRRFQHIQELFQVLERHVLGSLGVKLLPGLVEQVVVLICDAFLDVFICLKN